MQYPTMDQFHELKLIAYFSLALIVLMFFCLLALGLVVNRVNYLLKQARESQLTYFSKTDKLLDNQELFRGNIKQCKADLTELKSLVHTLKEIGFDLQSAVRVYEGRNQIKNDSTAKNKFKIGDTNTRKQLPENERLERLEKLIEKLIHGI